MYNFEDMIVLATAIMLLLNLADIAFLADYRIRRRNRSYSERSRQLRTMTILNAAAMAVSCVILYTVAMNM